MYRRENAGLKLNCMYWKGRNFNLYFCLKTWFIWHSIHFEKEMYILTVLISLFKCFFNTCCRNLVSLYVGFVRYNLTVGHCHMLVIFNCIPYIIPYSSINGKFEVLTVVLKKILVVWIVDGFLKWSENKLICMASYLRRLGCQYRQILLHSSHICLIIHIMFNCGGLPWQLYLSSIKNIVCSLHK
jgi:hypothetical protein